jgi:serine protease Do
MNYVLNSRADWCLLQVDANMSSGSSGGPIVNADGDVVGVSVMVQTAGTAGVGSLNFGVAMDQAWPIIQSLLRNGYVTRAQIGMTIVLVDPLNAAREQAATGVPLLPPPGSVAAADGGDYFTGLLVTYTVPGKPAEGAGIREGDVILEINGRRMLRKGDYFAALGPVHEPGKSLLCKVYRPPTDRASGPGKVFTCAIAPTVREESVLEQRRRGLLRRR